MNVREQGRERERARKWFAALANRQRWDLGDAFVLNTFDWRDWFTKRPTGVFLREVDEERIRWEIMSS